MHSSKGGLILRGNGAEMLETIQLNWYFNFVLRSMDSVERVETFLESKLYVCVFFWLSATALTVFKRRLWHFVSWCNWDAVAFFRLPGLVRIAQHSVWPAADSSGKLTLNWVERCEFIIRKPSRVTAEKCFGCSRYYGDEATPASSVFGFVFFWSSQHSGAGSVGVNILHQCVCVWIFNSFDDVVSALEVQHYVDGLTLS